MDCASSAPTVSEAQQASVVSQIQYALLAKQLQAQRQQGESVVELLQASVTLSKALGTGEQFDAEA